MQPSRFGSAADGNRFDTRAGDFDIADFAWVATPFATSNKSIYSTGGGQNYGKFSSPAVDAAFNEAVGILDETKRTAKFNEIDKLLGKPWDDELETFRYAGEGAPVRWLHQVV